MDPWFASRALSSYLNAVNKRHPGLLDKLIETRVPLGPEDLDQFDVALVALNDNGTPTVGILGLLNGFLGFLNEGEIEGAPQIVVTTATSADAEPNGTVFGFEATPESHIMHVHGGNGSYVMVEVSGEVSTDELRNLHNHLYQALEDTDYLVVTSYPVQILDASCDARVQTICAPDVKSPAHLELVRKGIYTMREGGIDEIPNLIATNTSL